MSGLLVVMDFDGTITSDDCLDAILRRHTQGWPAMLERIARQEIGRVAALQQQVGELRLSAAELIAEFAAEAQPRPGFAEFLQWLAAVGGRAAVVSLGFRAGIEAVWEREGLPPVEIFASEVRTVDTGGAGDGSRRRQSARLGSLRVSVDARFGDCELCGPGACKAPVLQLLRRPEDLVVAFGDGTADLCLARRAHLTFARGRLADICEAEGLPHLPLVDFVAARADLAVWLARRPSER
jgi:2-hydroxy-3-keto-5-methylthiopentenyl-1-phosphate phosphatase